MTRPTSCISSYKAEKNPLITDTQRVKTKRKRQRGRIEVGDLRTGTERDLKSMFQTKSIVTFYNFYTLLVKSTVGLLISLNM